MAGKSKKYKDFPSQAGLYVEVVSRCTPKERLWGKVVRRVAQLQAKGYQSTCSNTRKFMCNLLLRKSDGKKARFIIIIKNRCISACNDFFASYRDFQSISAIFTQRFCCFRGKSLNDYATKNLRWMNCCNDL